MSQAVEFRRSGAFAHVPNPWEVRLHPNSAAAWTVNVTPGSATAGVLAQLDPERLSRAGRVNALVGLERLQAWAAALQAQMIAALVDEPHVGAVAPKLDRDWAKEDVKTALAESICGTQARIHTATDLVHRPGSKPTRAAPPRRPPGPPASYPVDNTTKIKNDTTNEGDDEPPTF